MNENEKFTETNRRIKRIEKDIGRSVTVNTIILTILTAVIFYCLASIQCIKSSSHWHTQDKHENPTEIIHHVIIKGPLR